MMLGSLGCSVVPRATLRGDAGLLSYPYPYPYPYPHPYP